MSYRIRRVGARLAAGILLLQFAPGAAAAAPGPAITAIVADGAQTCALTSVGGVKCWGANIGNGTTAPSLTSVDVVALSSGITALAAGGQHKCVLTSLGGVKCWGSNAYGQLGNGTTTNSLTPVDVLGLTSHVTAITAGNYHSCALLDVAVVRCWGQNKYGQLGNGTRDDNGIPSPPLPDSSVPVFVAGGITAIDAGGFHTCAITTSGAVYCWGSNVDGQLGFGDTPLSSVPVDLPDLSSGITAISAGGHHTCALTSVGGVKCWGNSAFGQLGIGFAGPGRNPTPTDVSDLASGVTAITAGAFHTCALTDGGGVKCWGSGDLGRLGNGETIDLKYPSDVTGLGSGITAISAGYYHTCAITNVGGVKCWGANYGGTLGNATRIGSPVPIDVDLAPVQTIRLATSKPAGRIVRGTVAWFTANIRLLGPVGVPAFVRFVVYERHNGAWRKTAQQDVSAVVTGRATMRWRFSTAGSWYVRARVLGNASWAATAWSPLIRYEVR